jgi:hypothetical protein
MAQELKRLIVQRFGDQEAVPIAVAPGETVRDVLTAIGAPGALGLCTASAGPGFVLLPGAVIFTQIPDGAHLYVLSSCCPGS